MLIAFILSCMLQVGAVPENIISRMTAKILMGLNYLHKYKHMVRVMAWGSCECACHPRQFSPCMRRPSHTHASLQVHRDIKPANILMNLDGEPKITDFGISAFINSTLAVVSACAGFHEVAVLVSPKQQKCLPAYHTWMQNPCCAYYIPLAAVQHIPRHCDLHVTRAHQQ